MDSLITAAARALAAGDPVGALKRVALRTDAPALALRGTAMAQMGDFTRARALLRAAARAFGAREPLMRARCVVADAEVALASRDLAWDATALESARALLAKHGDHANADHARYLEVRWLLLLGRLDAAERRLATLDAGRLPPALRTAHELVVAGIALRRVHARDARAALLRAERAARLARIPALWGEVGVALRALDTTAGASTASTTDSEGTGPTAPGADGTDGADGPSRGTGAGDSGGCNCRVDLHSHPGAWLLALLGLSAHRRRKRSWLTHT